MVTSTNKPNKNWMVIHCKLEYIPGGTRRETRKWTPLCPVSWWVRTVLHVEPWTGAADGSHRAVSCWTAADPIQNCGQTQICWKEDGGRTGGVPAKGEDGEVVVCRWPMWNKWAMNRATLYENGTTLQNMEIGDKQLSSNYSLARTVKFIVIRGGTAHLDW